MKRLLMIALMIWLPVGVGAQAVNPRNTFVNATNANNPSLWLNFNDANTNFVDSISGLAFSADNLSSSGSFPGGLTGGNTGGTIGVNAVAFSASGTLQSINFQANGTPATTQTFLILSGTAPSLTIAASFTATVAATSNPQVLVAGVNFVAPTVTAGEFLGNWVSSGTSVGYASSGVNGVYYLTGQVSLPGGAQTYGSATGSYAILGAVVTPSLATPRQAGFDNTNNANYSAEFPYNQWNVAPNNALSTIDWNSPWTMMLHVDRFNWDHAAPIYLASKGDLNSAAVNNNWWALFVQPNTGNSNTSQLCFARNGLAPDTAPNTGGTFVVNQRWCTALYIDMMPNSFNYNIIVEDSGTGGGNALSVWLNGIAMPLVVTASGNGFGGVTTAVTSGGSGYPTGGVAYSSTGGGANCLVTGTANVTSGVVTSTTNQTDQGCTSAPTIGLVASSGSGAVIAATAYPMTMNSTSAPLMVPGYKINGTEYGPGGTDTAQSPLYVDEFAEFPGNLSFGQITNIFYETKFYQGLLYSGLRASPPLVILGGFGCGPDFSGDQTLAMTIGAHQAGLIRLIGVVDDDGNANGSNSVGWWREMLDQAGLNDVPLSVGGGSQTSNVGGCPTANITGYNASTPQNASSYESALTMYRTLFARYPSAPIYVLMTQTANGYNNFQLSPADGISPLTGLQLQTRNYANGGWINGFQGNLNLTPSSYASVWTNMGTGPVYMWGGSPASGGPGVLVSRTATDPLYLTATLAGAPADVVAGWTNLNLAQVITSYFGGGEMVTVSGGTGYASTTKFTSVGGGPACNVTGLMAATSGVPNGMLKAWGVAPAATYDGIGYGCTPASFTATGSGTSLTVSAVALGSIMVGDTIAGTGIPTGTTIVSQASGTPGGVGVYVTSGATTASTSTVTRTPTIVLTSPTGTGVVFAVTNGTFAQNYGGTGMGQYTAYPSQWAQPNNLTEANAPVFTWFQNSLMDPPTTGAARPY